jgi:hypothetical protein
MLYSFADTNSNFQNSNFQKDVFNTSLSFLGNAFKKSKYVSTFSYNFQNTDFNSNNSLALNNLSLIKNFVSNSSSFSFDHNKWRFRPSILFTNLSQKLNDSNLFSNDLLFEPSINLKYAINNNSFIVSNLSFNKNTFPEQYVFQNDVIVNNRIIIKNIPSLEIQQSEVINIAYFNNNLYRNFSFNLGINYQKNDGNFFSELLINENQTLFNNLYLNESNDNLQVNLFIEKFVSFLSSTFKVNSILSNANYKNFVNSSELRNNNSITNSNSFSWKTAFLSKLNFENEMRYYTTTSKLEGFGVFSNTSFINHFKLKYDVNSQFFAYVSHDYFIPSLSQNNTFSFIDFSILLKPKNKQFEFNLIGKNMLNLKTFRQIQTSDYSINTLENNLVARYVYLNCTITF